MTAFHSHSQRSGRPLVGVVLLGLFALAGCGVESYETRMAATIDDLKLDNKFVGLAKKYTLLVAPRTEASPPLEPDQLPLAIAPRIRLPIIPGVFAAYTAESANPDNAGERIPADRVFPPTPLPAIPGYQETFEQFITTTAGTRPWYLYIGVLRHAPGSGGGAAQLAKILEEAKAAVPSEPDLAWKDTPILSSQKGAPQRVWKTLDLKSQQLFYVRGNTPGEVSGICKIMVLDVPGRGPIGDHQIFLVWRLVPLTKEYQRILDLMAASVGTLEIDPVALAPAKPN